MSIYCQFHCQAEHDPIQYIVPQPREGKRGSGVQPLPSLVRPDLKTMPAIELFGANVEVPFYSRPPPPHLSPTGRLTQ